MRHNTNCANADSLGSERSYTGANLNWICCDLKSFQIYIHVTANRLCRSGTCLLTRNFHHLIHHVCTSLRELGNESSVSAQLSQMTAITTALHKKGSLWATHPLRRRSNTARKEKKGKEGWDGESCFPQQTSKKTSIPWSGKTNLSYPAKLPGIDPEWKELTL